MENLLSKFHPEGPSTPEQRARYESESAATLAKFDEARRAYEARREASGLNRAIRDAEVLSRAQWDAEDIVLEAKPRTHAGAIALLMFAAEYTTDDPSGSAHHTIQVLVNVAAFLAGKPLEISTELKEVLDGQRV